MRIFHCDCCQQLVFFENFQCTSCGARLAYLQDAAEMGALATTGDASVWRRVGSSGGTYRLCDNDTRHQVCNWAIPANAQQTLCRSCALTQVIPDLSRSGHREAWYRLEVAKRRLIASVLLLRLPLLSKEADAERGLAFRFLAQAPEKGAARVSTGHSNGVITIDVAEADDAERERRRLALREPYRTLLGHFRHESGHYYWERLIGDAHRVQEFRALFGDESADYAAARARHYESGAPGDWQEHFVSTYASMHPFEDWAETWAHYIHMVDALETAQGCGVSLRPRRADEPRLEPAPQHSGPPQFAQIIADWGALTYMMNNLNRGLGLPDGYPFVLSAAAVEKLGFVHRVIAEQQSGGAGSRANVGAAAARGGGELRATRG